MPAQVEISDAVNAAVMKQRNVCLVQPVGDEVLLMSIRPFRCRTLGRLTEMMIRDGCRWLDRAAAQSMPTMKIALEKAQTLWDVF